MPRYIDADALISKIAFHRDSLKPYNVVAVSAFDAVIDFIKRRPTVSTDEVRGVGEWEEIEVMPKAYDICGVKTWASKMQCCNCGFTTFTIEGHFSQYNYCPSCGARMKGAEDGTTD